MGDPILDDGAYQSTLEDVTGRIWQAFVEVVAGERPVETNVPQPPPGSGVPNVGPSTKHWQELVEECKGIYDECMQYVGQLAVASTTAAKANLDNTQATMDALEKQSGEEMGTVIKTIRGLTATWSGSTSAVNFQTYVNELETALEYQFRYAGSMHALMNLHRELIFASREGVLDVCDITLKGLGQAAAQKRAEEESKRRQNWATTIETAFAIVGGAVSGGMVGAVVATIGGLGSAISSRITSDNPSSDPREIMYAMRRSIVKLRRDIRHEEDLLLEGIKELLTYTESKRGDILAPVIPG